jgi:hypothetical protein
MFCFAFHDMLISKIHIMEGYPMSKDDYLTLQPNFYEDYRGWKIMIDDNDKFYFMSHDFIDPDRYENVRDVYHAIDQTFN